jgi:tetratricopeptide (TPR) repeat protein
MPEQLTSVPINYKLKDAINRANALCNAGKLDESINYTLAVKGFFDEPKYLRRLLNNLGYTYYEKGEFEQAVDSYMEALELPVNDSEDEFESAAVEGNIANALVALGRTEEAHLFLDKAERVLRLANEDVWLGDRLETRARAYLLEGKFKLALDAAKEAFDLHWNAFNTESLKQSINTLARCFEAYEREMSGAII